MYNRADGSQLALLSATEDDSFHPLAVIETIKRLGDLRSAAFRYMLMLLCVSCSRCAALKSLLAMCML